MAYERSDKAFWDHVEKMEAEGEAMREKAKRDGKTKPADEIVSGLKKNAGKERKHG